MTDRDGSRYVMESYKKLSMKADDGTEIAYLSYKIDPDEPDLLEIGWSRVEEKYRKQGIQTKMFDELFANNPQVRRIQTSLDDVNADAFNKELAAVIKKQPDYKAPVSQLDQAKRDSFIADGKLDLLELNDCCREYIAQLGKSSAKRLEEISEEALKGTPAWQTRKRYGFTKISHKDYYLKPARDGTVNPNIMFIVEKP